MYRLGLGFSGMSMFFPARCWRRWDRLDSEGCKKGRKRIMILWFELIVNFCFDNSKRLLRTHFPLGTLWSGPKYHTLNELYPVDKMIKRNRVHISQYSEAVIDLNDNRLYNLQSRVEQIICCKDDKILKKKKLVDGAKARG